MPNYLKPEAWKVPFLLLVSTLCAAQAPHPEPVIDQETELGQLGAALFLSPSLAQMLAIQMIGDLHSLARDVESPADVTGSDVCAATGYNPWGLV